MTHITVPPECAGERADRFLAVNLPELSRTRIQELIAEGSVTLGGKRVKCSEKLKSGAVFDVEIPEPAVPDAVPEEMELDILYEDEDLLVVNKPKGLAVHPAPGHESGTLVNGLLYYLGGSLSGIGGVLRPGIVHRIDMNTTGSLVICKNDESHRRVAEQLKTHSIKRVYRGICTGIISENEGRIEGAIGRDRNDRKKMAVVREGGKEAVTHYRVLERFRGYTYCEFRLETGRTHQIRVHMASIRHPLLGDDVYGPSRCPFDLQGQTLHAMTIGFIHPGTGEYMEFDAPLPEYFEKLLAVLRKNCKIT